MSMLSSQHLAGSLGRLVITAILMTAKDGNAVPSRPTGLCLRRPPRRVNRYNLSMPVRRRNVAS